MYREVGKKRKDLRLQELLILKKRLGLSIQAILYRLKDLEIINNSYYSSCFRVINRMGWRKSEPEPLAPEHPDLFKQQILRAYAEGLINKNDAEKAINEKIEGDDPLSLEKVRSIMQLSKEERRKLLAEQASKLADYYCTNTDKDWQAGDFKDY